MRHFPAKSRVARGLVVLVAVLVATAAFGATTFGAGTATSGGIYQIVNDAGVQSIQRLNLDGTNRTTLVTPVSSQSYEMYVVEAGGYLYWTKPYTSFSNGGNGTIGRAKADGTEVDHDFIAVGFGGGLTVDATHVYWHESSGGSYWVSRAKLDGTNVERRFVQMSADFPWEIQVSGDYLYWTALSAKKIGRVKLDGTDTNPNLVPGLTKGPESFTIADGYIIWEARSSLGRAKIDGSEANEAWGPAGSSARLLRYAAPYLYVQEFRTTYRMNVDGTGKTVLNTGTGTVRDLWATPASFSFTHSLTPASIPANGTSTSIATFDANGATGHDVKFTTDGGQTIGATVESPPGVYKATIQSTTTPGASTITATDSTAGVTDTKTLTQTAGEPEDVSVDLDPEEIVADGQTQSTATVTVKDADNVPLNGETVELETTGGQAISSVVPGSARGTYTATITSTETAGDSTIKATVTSTAAQPHGQATLHQIAGAPTKIDVSLFPATIDADGVSESVATATVKDAHNNLISGEDVAITAPAGGPQVGEVEPGLTPGTYRATIRASTTPGDVTITATDSSPATPISNTAVLKQNRAPAKNISLELDPGTLPATGRATTTATATVTDAGNNPVTGETVTIESDGDQAVSEVKPGSAPGTYVATITSTRAVGDATITATDTSADPDLTDTATLEQTALTAAHISLSLEPATITADGESTSVATATVTDLDGVGVTGEDVEITSDDADHDITAVTEGSEPGEYVATITSTRRPGDATITAKDISLDEPIDDDEVLTQEPGPATGIDLELDPASITADGTETTKATVTLTDDEDKPVLGHVVELESSSTNAIGTVTEGGEPGTYEATITSTETAGDVTITATDTTMDDLSDEATLEQTAGPATDLSLELDPSTIVADGESTSVATATVTDTHDNPVDGETVTIETDGGQSITAVAAGDDDGTYVATITSSEKAGDATITATDTSAAAKPDDEAVLSQVAGPAKHIALEVAPDEIVADGVETATATATVTDEHDNPVDGHDVDFATTGAQEITDEGEGTEDGTYVATIRSSTTAGTSTITATDTTVEDPLSDTAPLSQVAGPPATVGLVLAPAAVAADPSSTSKATATVSDAHGNPVTGETVTIESSPAQTLSPRPGSEPGTTLFADADPPAISAVRAGEEDGTYEATVTASRTIGTFTLTATDRTADPDVAGTAAFRQTTPQSTNVSLTLSPASIVADGETTTVATAKVTDRDGGPLTGETVEIAAGGGQQVGPVTAGSEPGTYRATIRSTTTAGASTITATDRTADPDVAATATLTQTRMRAAHVALALAPSTIAGDTRATTKATATVTDAAGRPVSGDDVRFTSTGGQTISAVEAGSAPGTYVATIRAGRGAGTAAITARDVTPDVHVSDTRTLTQTALPAKDVTVELAPSEVTADGAARTTATATVVDGDGFPVSGDTVKFTSTGDQRIGAVRAGTAPGTYQADVIASTLAGTSTITATDTGAPGTPHGKAVLTQVADRPARVKVTLAQAAIVADGESETLATATVEDVHGNPVSSEDVDFGTTGGQSLTATEPGDAAGTYETTIRSTETAGKAVITATDVSPATPIAGSATLTQKPGDPDKLELALDPSSIPADRTASTTATATVTDEHGNGVPGETVTIASSGSQRVGEVHEGEAPGTYVATIDATLTPGTAKITATDAGPDPDLSDDAELEQTSRTSATVAVELTPATLVGNGRTTTRAKATVTDRNGDPLVGRAVTFKGSGDQQVGAVTPGSEPGTYEATITSSPVAETATITATDTVAEPDRTGTATLTQTRAQATAVKLELSPATVQADGTATSTATATVTDGEGFPVSGDDVVFTSTGTQKISATRAGSEPGTYVATITSSATAGTATITASDRTPATPVSKTATLTQEAGPATDVALRLAPASITADGLSTTTATATVTDAKGNPVGGQDVRLTAADGREVGTVTPGSAPGTYVATIRASTVARTTEITATDHSVLSKPSGHAMLTQVAGAPKTVAVSLTPDSLVADGTATTDAVARVTDTFGNPVSGETVTITAGSGQQVGAVTAGTDPGTYVATIRASTTAGTTTVTAKAVKAVPPISGTAPLTQTAGPAKTVDLAFAPGAIPADGATTSVATATVTDTNGNPVTGDDVSFSSDGPQSITSTRPGAAPGTYEATITASTVRGDVAITATDSSVTPAATGTGTLVQTARPASKVEVALSPTSIVADGRAQTTATVTVTDVEGTGVSGQAIELSSSRPNRIGPVTETATPGVYRATLTSTTTAGTATVEATDTSVASHPKGEATLTQTAGAVPGGLTGPVWTEDLPGPAAILGTTEGASGRRTLVPTIARGTAVAVDDAAIFFANPATGAIGRADRDGANVNRSLVTGITTPRSIAVGGDFLYWATGDGRIGRSRRDGSEVTHAFITDAGTPTAIAATGSHLYWTSYAFGSIGRARIDGTGANAKLIPNAGDSEAIAVDDTHVYWGATKRSVRRAKLDGTGVETFAPQETGSLTRALGLDAQHVLWARGDGSAVGRGRKDGVSSEPAFVAAAGAVRSIAVLQGASLTLGPGSITADDRSTTTARVLLTDAYGNPAADAPAPEISSSGEQKVGPVTATGAPGEWQAPITATDTAGSATITARGDGPAGHEPLARATLTQTPAPSGRVKLALAPAMIFADGKSTTTATVTVTDLNDNLVSTPETVRLTSTGGQAIGPVTRTLAGTYRATITSTAERGTASITATATSVGDRPSDTQTLTQTGVPWTISVVPQRDYVLGDGISTGRLTIDVHDMWGDPVDGVDLTLGSDQGRVTFSPVKADPVPGAYTATVKAPAGTTGPEVITATAANGRVGRTVLFISSPNPSPPTATVVWPEHGRVVSRGQTVDTRFFCAESADGPGLTDCADSNGGQGTGYNNRHQRVDGTLDTSTPGEHTYTVRASSRSGLTGTQEIPYTVIGPPTAEVVGYEGDVEEGGEARVRIKCSDSPATSRARRCGIVQPGTDPREVSDCSWRWPGCGDVSEPIDTSTQGRHTIRIAAVGDDNQVSVIEETYTVGPPNRLRATLSSDRTTIDMVIARLLNRTIGNATFLPSDGMRLKFTASVEGGRPPYRYDWRTFGADGAEVHERAPTGEPLNSMLFYPYAARSGAATARVRVIDATGREAYAEKEFRVVDSAEEYATPVCKRTVGLGAAAVSFPVGDRFAGACFAELPLKGYETGLPVMINGVLFEPSGGVVIDTYKDEISFDRGGRVTVCVNRDAYEPQLGVECDGTRLRLRESSTPFKLTNLRTKGAVHADFGGIPSSILGRGGEEFAGLPISGSALSFGPQSLGAGASEPYATAIDLRVALPELRITSAPDAPLVSGELRLNSWRQAGNTFFEGGAVRAPEAYLDGLKVQDVCFKYGGAHRILNTRSCPGAATLDEAETCGPLASERFLGTFDLSLGGAPIKAQAGIAGGRLQYATFGKRGTGHDVTLASPTSGIFLREIGTTRCFFDGAIGNGFATITALPRTAADDAEDDVFMSGKAVHMNAPRPGQPWELNASGQLTLGVMRLNKGTNDDSVKVTSNGAMSFETNVDMPNGSQGRWSMTNGTLRGWVQPTGAKGFNGEGDVDLCVEVGSRECGRATAVVSSKGMAACFTKQEQYTAWPRAAGRGSASEAGVLATLAQVRAPTTQDVNNAIERKNESDRDGITRDTVNRDLGAWERFGNSLANTFGGSTRTRSLSIGVTGNWATGVNLLGSSCGLGDWRVPVSQPAARAAQDAQPAGAGQVIVVEPKQPLLLLRAKGVAGPPRVRLRSPDGRVLESAALGGPALGDRMRLWPDDEQGATMIVVADPAPGRWTVEPLDLGRLAKVEQSDALPAPEVFGRVKGHGRRRALLYAWMPQSNMDIRFFEKGEKDGASASIGRATSTRCPAPVRRVSEVFRCGRVVFAPARGEAGERTIVAEITRGGMPLENRDVATYDAPGPPRPTKIRRARVARGPKATTVAWTRSPLAATYEVTVKTSTGLRVLRTTGRSCRRIKLPGIGRAAKVQVKIKALDAYGLAGPVTKRLLRPGQRTNGSRDLARVRCSR